MCVKCPVCFRIEQSVLLLAEDIKKFDEIYPNHYTSTLSEYCVATLSPVQILAITILYWDTTCPPITTGKATGECVSVFLSVCVRAKGRNFNEKVDAFPVWYGQY